MARGQQTVEASAGAARRLPFHAELYGGRGTGATIRLEELAPRISVYQNGGPAFAVIGEPLPESPDGAAFIGIYELVGPVGPETPIYVPGH